MGEVIRPGAFDKFVGLSVPVTIGGRVVGKAEISRDGEIINAELESGALPRELRDMFHMGFADALSIDTVKTKAVPREPTQEEKSQCWQQATLPWGM